jgi:hypothetical protein
MKLFKITIYDFGGSYYNRLVIDDGYDKIQDYPRMASSPHSKSYEH